VGTDDKILSFIRSDGRDPYGQLSVFMEMREIAREGPKGGNCNIQC
jgi:hypothetical protein